MVDMLKNEYKMDSKVFYSMNSIHSRWRSLIKFEGRFFGGAVPRGRSGESASVQPKQGRDSQCMGWGGKNTFSGAVFPIVFSFTLTPSLPHPLHPSPSPNAALRCCYGPGMGFAGMDLGTIGPGEFFEVVLKGIGYLNFFY